MSLISPHSRPLSAGSFSPRAQERGFTLIEVMISIAILVLISIGISQMISSSFRLKDVLTVEGDFYNGIRLGMSVIERDLTLLYSPTQFTAPPDDNAPPITDPNLKQAAIRDQEALQSGDLGRSSKFWGSALNLAGVRPSRFVGTDSKVSFIAASHIRVYRNAAESDLLRVTYELKPDSNLDPRIEKKDGLQMLVRQVDTDVYMDDFASSSQNSDNPTLVPLPILRAVRGFKWRYYRKDKDTWSTNWDSDREEFKNRYPDRIEISYEAIGPFNLSYDAKYLLRGEIPLDALPPTL
jgi:general secretion pathway protein J